jgi:hypothetical protein
MIMVIMVRAIRLTAERRARYNAGMSDLTSTIASLQRRVEEIAVHL